MVMVLDLDDDGVNVMVLDVGDVRLDLVLFDIDNDGIDVVLLLINDEFELFKKKKTCAFITLTHP